MHEKLYSETSSFKNLRTHQKQHHCIERHSSYEDHSLR